MYARRNILSYSQVLKLTYLPISVSLGDAFNASAEEEKKKKKRRICDFLRRFPKSLNHQPSDRDVNKRKRRTKSRKQRDLSLSFFVISHGIPSVYSSCIDLFSLAKIRLHDVAKDIFNRPSPWRSRILQHKQLLNLSILTTTKAFFQLNMLPFYFLRPFKAWIPLLSSWLFSCFAAVGITVFIWIQFFSMRASLELVCQPPTPTDTAC